MQESVRSVNDFPRGIPAQDVRTAELILCCARSRRDPESVRRIRTLVCEGVDWAHVMEIALRNTMVPLLYDGLRSACPETVPSETLQEIRTHFQNNSWRNLYLARELIRILKLFEGHGISAVPYKGLALAASVYGELALRQFGDLDLLVHRGDVMKAEKLLKDLGYEPERSHAGKHASLKYHYHLSFLRKADRVYVEVHWAFSGPYSSFGLEIKGLWDRLEQISLAGALVNSFCPEDLLLILCTHASKDLWRRLIWVCDIAEFIVANPDLDWRRVMDQSKELGCRRKLWLGLRLASSLLRSSPPNRVIESMQKDRAMESLVLQISGCFFSRDSNSLHSIDRRLFYSMMKERFREKLKYLLSRCPVHLRALLTPTERDVNFLLLPERLSFVRYLLRPIRLSRDYLVSIPRHRIKR
jgi:hypothetical protein